MPSHPTLPSPNPRALIWACGVLLLCCVNAAVAESPGLTIKSCTLWKVGEVSPRESAFYFRRFGFEKPGFLRAKSATFRSGAGS